MSDKIKFGTDGWRAIIGDTYTVRNVARVAEAVAQWVKQESDTPSIVIGHDCRFNGKLFMETAIKVFHYHNIHVFYADGFVSTPMVSMGTRKHNATIGVILTASHNPPSYGGFKLKSKFGGPLLPKGITEVENLIPETHNVTALSSPIASILSKENIEKVDLEEMYIESVKEHFDLDAIRNSDLELVYDAMYGAGQRVMRRLFPNIDFLHCDYNPSFKGQAPEPIDRNLQPLSRFIKEKGTIDVALATDGDADRIGLYDGNGEFVDSHHIMLLLIHYMVKYKQQKGKVVTAASSSPKIAKLCDFYGLPHESVKIGFKHIAGKMIDEDLLLGGEESGGIAVQGHIPERDGIWMGMILWEFMAKSGKSLDSLINEVYEIVGAFKFERDDLHIDETLKQSIVKNCEDGKYTSFGSYTVEKLTTIDGFKYHLPNENWVMIRPSGTEPVLRVYAQGKDLDEVRDILKATRETIL